MRISTTQLTERTRAIPLRNTATGGGPQHLEMKHSLDFYRGVAVDLTSEAYFFEIGTSPSLHL
jgi:hypothetical protein